MLKRFMNWLLHRLQRLLGVLSGKSRGQSRSGVSSQSPFVLDRQSNQPAPFNASRLPSSDLGDSLPDATSSANERSSSSQPVNIQQSSDAVAADILDPMLAEPDTHRRLNASSAALPGATPQVPSFPTEVSELISSSPAQSATSSAEPEQLPAIHDLLPAIEPDESEGTPKPPVPQAILCSFEITESDVNPVLQDSDSTVEPLSAGEITSADSLLDSNRKPGASSPTSVTSESSLLTPEVASLIVEEAISEEEALAEAQSAADRDLDIPVADASGETPSEEHAPDRRMAQQPLAVEQEDDLSVADASDEMLSEGQDPDQVMVQQPLAVEQEEDITIDIELEDPTAVAELTTPFADQPSASDLLPAFENEPLEPIQEESEEAGIVAAQVSGLPYPWSLAASNKATQANAEIASDSSAAVGHQDFLVQADEPLLESEIDRSQSGSFVSTDAQSEMSSSVDETVFKNGVVKLLFTLKPGNFHGYIAPDDGTQDILFHQKYINADAFEQLSRGAKVVVTVKYIEGKAYAKQVDLV